MAQTTFSGPVVATNGFTGNVTGGINASSGYVQIPSDTDTNIADKDADINTSGKAVGSLVLDSSNNLLYVALGAGATDNWLLIDGVGSTTVTPS